MGTGNLLQDACPWVSLTIVTLHQLFTNSNQIKLEKKKGPMLIKVYNVCRYVVIDFCKIIVEIFGLMMYPVSLLICEDLLNGWEGQVNY